MAVWYLLLQIIFGQADRPDCYFRRVVRVVHDVAHDESAWIKWFEDDTISMNC